MSDNSQPPHGDYTDWAWKIRSLTEKQREVLGQIALNQDGGHNPRTVQVLMKRGLIEQYIEESREGGMIFRFKRYTVPIHVHIAWCEWCSLNVADEQE